MNKPRVILMLLSLFIFPSILLAQNTMTLTTYYPSPFGEYKKMTVTDFQHFNGFDPSVGPAFTCGVPLGAGRGNLWVDLSGALQYCDGTPINSISIWLENSATNSIYPKNLVTSNVGIGTSTPRKRLDVNGEVVAVDRVTLAQDTGLVTKTWHLDNRIGRFRIFEQPNINAIGTERLTITSPDGNVGIGLAGPIAKLDVYNSTALPAAAASLTELARFSGTTPNNVQLKTSLYRTSNAPTDWTTTSLLLSRYTDVTQQTFLSLFSPSFGENNFGINLYSPRATLHVYGGSGNSLQNNAGDKVSLGNFVGAVGNPFTDTYGLNIDLVRTANGVAWQTASMRLGSYYNTFSQAYLTFYRNTIGIGVTTPTIVASPSNGSSDGNLDANDVWLRGANKWASQASGVTVNQFTGGLDNSNTFGAGAIPITQMNWVKCSFTNDGTIAGSSFRVAFSSGPVGSYCQTYRYPGNGRFAIGAFCPNRQKVISGGGRDYAGSQYDYTPDHVLYGFPETYGGFQSIPHDPAPAIWTWNPNGVVFNINDEGWVIGITNTSGTNPFDGGIIWALCGG